MSDPQHDITGLLQAWRAGDAVATDALGLEVFATLKRMARAQVRGQTPLNPTALVNEAVVRLLGASSDWNSRAHFYALAALQMRSVLVDLSRRQLAEKRGGGAEHLTLNDEINATQVEFLELHQALNDLARIDARTARVLELSYFGGLTGAQVAAAMAISVATVERDLQFGRAWLKRELQS